VNALRADHVGSLLRPSGLLQARVDHFAGRLDDAGLRAEEDRAILEALQRQRDCGLDVQSDGEFRRSGFMAGFLAAVDGLAEPDLVAPATEPAGIGRGGQPGAVAARLRSRRRIAQAEAGFMCAHAIGPFKVSLPSPLLFAGMAQRPDLVAEAAAILAAEARLLAAEGVPCVQVDAPGYAQFADPGLARRIRDGGDDPVHLLDAAIAADNQVLDAAREGGALAAIHLCRGDSHGRWLADGGSDALAERLFTRLRCDRVLLDWRTQQPAGFRPLRFVPARMVVSLGLVSTAAGEPQSADDLLRLIDQASRVVALEQLAISPRCGFASSQVGSAITHDDQWRRLELVAGLAREVWP
jgi:5-methyltetrahydropteroyltriglutamate--homocysteine methyltransferase